MISKSSFFFFFFPILAVIFIYTHIPAFHPQAPLKYHWFIKLGLHGAIIVSFSEYFDDALVLIQLYITLADMASRDFFSVAHSPPN